MGESTPPFAEASLPSPSPSPVSSWGTSASSSPPAPLPLTAIVAAASTGAGASSSCSGAAACWCSESDMAPPVALLHGFRRGAAWGGLESAAFPCFSGLAAELESRFLPTTRNAMQTPERLHPTFASPNPKPATAIPQHTPKNMSSIGPQLPSQPSSKRKPTPEVGDDDVASKQARHNTDEIELDDGSDSDDDDDDDDDDDYGPRAPGPAPAPAPSVSRPSVGPSLPPPSATHNKDEIDLDDSDSDSDDDTGPAPPPPPPPASAAATAAAPAPTTEDSDSSSDDDYGPALPSAANARRGPIGPAMPPAEDTSAPTRDEWMLAPPTNSGYSERDPTKLKARKFASKPSASGGGSSDAGAGLAAIWTETPEEKLKRLQDSVLGRSDGSGKSAGEVAAAEARSKEEEEKNRRIAASIAAHRGKSLYDEHQREKEVVRKKTGKGEEEDDPSKRAFDREKDMALGSKIGSAQRKELVAKSANFGGRFQKGSFL
ncbi:hypothetical protein PWT90_06863 [Aphanocladium album]|nr:hypothetical protein PWT90_06863 [Aphanocladium album]